MANLMRQGDVLIIPIKAIPKSAKLAKPDNGRVILAYGEATGHAHAILERASMWEDIAAGRNFLSVAEGGADVVHEEHSTIKLDAGLYEVRRQREYSPEAIRNVSD